MSATLYLSPAPGEIWAALVDAEELVELRVLRPGEAHLLGLCFLGRVVALRPDLPAVLVDIGRERPGFLSAEDAAPGSGIGLLHEGEAVLVQVTKSARADKAAGLSMRLRLKGELADLLPLRPGITAARGMAEGVRLRLTALLAAAAVPGEGYAIHREASEAAESALLAEAEALRVRWRRIEAARRQATPPMPLETPEPLVAVLLRDFLFTPPAAIVIEDRAAYAEARNWLARYRPDLVARLELHADPAPLFEAVGIDMEIATALGPRVPLAGGGSLIIETNAAATMIDVDSSSAPALATNLAAARVAARQIRLRNLAGPIVIDFIGLKKRDERDRVTAALAAALAEDPGKPELLGWTRLGHVELVRPRRHAPLADILYEPASGGAQIKTALTLALEALRALAREVDRVPGRIPVLIVHPDIAAAFETGEGRTARQNFEARLGQELVIRAEPNRARDAIDIRPR